MRVPGALLIAIGFAGLVVWAAHGPQNVVFTIVGVACALTLWGTAVWTIASSATERAQAVPDN